MKKLIYLSAVAGALVALAAAGGAQAAPASSSLGGISGTQHSSVEKTASRKKKHGYRGKQAHRKGVSARHSKHRRK